MFFVQKWLQQITDGFNKHQSGQRRSLEMNASQSFLQEGTTQKEIYSLAGKPGFLWILVIFYVLHLLLISWYY